MIDFHLPIWAILLIFFTAYYGALFVFFILFPLCLQIVDHVMARIRFNLHMRRVGKQWNKLQAEWAEKEKENQNQKEKENLNQNHY